MSPQTVITSLLLLTFTVFNAAAAPNDYERMHREHHGNQGGKVDQPGHPLGGHDEVNMPGLQGKNTTAAEVDELRALFTQHQLIRRKVEQLPNGIRTITETDNEKLRPKLISHVVGMLSRIQAKRNPEVIIQSPTLTPLFQMSERIKTQVEMTPKGIVVVQTSDDQRVVKLLKTHAAEVSDMAARGMQAVHERMHAAHHK